MEIGGGWEVGWLVLGGFVFYFEGQDERALERSIEKYLVLVVVPRYGEGGLVGLYVEPTLISCTYVSLHQLLLPYCQYPVTCYQTNQYSSSLFQLYFFLWF